MLRSPCRAVPLLGREASQAVPKRKTPRKAAAPRRAQGRPSGDRKAKPERTRKAAPKRAKPAVRAKVKQTVKRAPRAGRKSSSARRKAAPVRRKAAPPPVVSVGDAVVMQVGEVNQIGRYDPRLARADSGAEATEGIVCSIREITTGKLVGKTKGDLTGYVLEVLHQRTFRPQFSSNRNVAGMRGGGADSPARAKLQALLRQIAQANRFVSHASGGLPNEVFGPLLDGWRVIKVRAQMVEVLA